MDHQQDYAPDYLADILKSVKTIAMVGASADATKFSYGVLRVLDETGYIMIPVNPNEAGNEIRGLKVYPSLASIDQPVDMVQVFRSSDALPGIANEAVEIGAKVLWAQLGVYNEKAAEIAEDAGLTVVMNRCPKIELFRPFWKPKLGQTIQVGAADGVMLMEPGRTFRVTLRNYGVTLDVGEDQPVYQAALEAGIQLPIGCNYGGCITCAAKLIEGKVRQPGATALNKRQAKAGYILLCVARPTTDCVIDAGVESHDELYQNPFAVGSS